MKKSTFKTGSYTNEREINNTIAIILLPKACERKRLGGVGTYEQ